jgi:myotubularin-related protein 6/7/8
MVGITQNRSIQDEKLIEATFQTHVSPDTRMPSGPVYGATTTNLIVDARPTANAMANTAKGAGTENMDNYKDARKAYLGIDHIHAMRESLAKVVEALREADAMLTSINSDLSGQISGISVLDRQALRRSSWLRHIRAIIEGTVLISRNVHVNSSHVLIHCSDGWDRTSQLSSLSQLCLDPYYRTIKGFEILIEKDWLSFGHKFLDRCGHLSSEKFFVSPTETPGSGSGTDAAQAFLASVQNRFASQHHIKETSPVFHQFLESVRQVQRQFPARFEFNERFLRQLYYHLYSCQFGTFLFNNEKERKTTSGLDLPPCERTCSVWDFFNSPAEMEKNRNQDYDPSLDDPTSRASGADMGVLFPNPKDIRFWNELYGRTDEEMNGRIIMAASKPGEVTENLEDEVGIPRIATPSNVSSPPSPKVASAPIPVPSAQSLSTPRTVRAPSPVGSGGLIEPSALLPVSPPSINTYSLAAPSSSPSAVSDWSSPSSSSYQRGRPDFLSGAGMGVKSVWGRLSSNASTAFSAVQGAYAGVAKDLGRRAGGNEDEASVKTAEMHSREMLSTWGEASSIPSTSKVTSSLSAMSTSSNPWSPEQQNADSSIPLRDENSWSDSTTSQQKFPVPSTELTSSLPLDPTIPTPLRRMTASSTTQRTDIVQPIKVPPENPGGTDPLGVGPL